MILLLLTGVSITATATFMTHQYYLFSRLVLLAATTVRGNFFVTSKVPFSSSSIFPKSMGSNAKKGNANKFTWFQTSSIGPDEDIVTDRVQSYPLLEGLDLSQSADWMEFIERKEGRLNDEGGAGAYDTMRCDVIIPSSKRDSDAIVWGESFHLDRLRNSYMELLNAKNKDGAARIITTNDEAAIEKAMEQSRKTLHHLLSMSHLEANRLLSEELDNKIDNEITAIQLVRITILWSPRKMKMIQQQIDETTEILVRGHACSNLEKILIPNEPPKPIQVSVAVHTNSKSCDKVASVDNSLPTRYTNPQSKIASWCRLRREMENTTFKPPGIEEVLMVRPRNDENGKECLEILEGLSSNVFMIYKNGMVRTASEGCLHGYVRHLVLDCLSRCGLTLDPRPIFLHESDQWQEAFITSSSRLIFPISKIFLPNVEHGEEGSADAAASSFSEFWCDKVLTGEVQSDASSVPKWRQLLNELLKEKGYE